MSHLLVPGGCIKSLQESAVKQLTGGIYAIRNTSTGDVYVGASINVPARWGQHIRELGRGVHANRSLQASWDAVGICGFTFEVLEVVSDNASLVEAEQRWIADTTPDRRLNRDLGNRTHNVAHTHVPEGFRNLTQAAAELGIAATTLRRWLDRLDISPRPAPYYDRILMVSDEEVETVRVALMSAGFSCAA